jgi:WS/DGAT/MGAT family acyltransferase
MTDPEVVIGEPLPLRPGERGKPLSAVDVAWLRMDEPANLMHIHGVIVLAGSPSRDQVAQLFERRLMAMPRFRQRIARDGDRYVWVDDAAFDLANHLAEEPLAEPGGDAELAAKIAEHLHRPFDRAHPFWEFRLFRGYRGGDTALFGRLHHTIGDGVAMMVVILALTDLTRYGPATIEPEAPGDAPHLNPFFEMLRLPSHEIGAAREAAERWMPDTLRLMQAPVDGFRRLHPLVKGIGSTAALLRLVGRWNDPATRFKGKLTVEKRVAWTQKIPLDTLKSAGRALGVTLNDLLNAAMAGGLRRYLARDGPPPEELKFRCAMPINLRPVEEMADLGNRFGLVFLSLPVGMSDPLARLEKLRRNADALKRSAEPLVVFRLLDLMGRLPLAAHHLIVSIFQAKATAVFTNVPGPRSTLWFAGHPVEDFFFWVPQAGRLGLGVSIFSYDGGVRMGVGTDAGLAPDPERIVDGFHAELDALLTAALRRGG